MLQQIKKIPKLNFDMSAFKNLLCKNVQAVKIYWPIILLIQTPIFIVCAILVNQKPTTQSAPLDKNNFELHKKDAVRLKNLEQRFNELNKRFAALQIQHAKFVKSSILLAATVQQTNPSSDNIIKKNALDTIDRIGEKIRLNETYVGLISGFPKECSGFAGYKTVQQFSSKLPLSIVQLKKSFEDIRKKYTTSKTKNELPKWLEKAAKIFHGNIKIEQTKKADESPIQSITEALETQDLKLAYSLTKLISFPPIQLWAQYLAERISLEEEYATFAENVQNWAQQAPSENLPLTEQPQEKLP